MRLPVPRAPAATVRVLGSVVLREDDTQDNSMSNFIKLELLI